MRAPRRVIQVGGRPVELRCNVYASLEYGELTGGGIEDAYFRLAPQIEAYEAADDLDRTHPVHDVRPWADLIYALSADWRDENWNGSHKSPEELGCHPRKGPRFTKLFSGMSLAECRRARPIIFSLLLEGILDVETEPPAGKKKGADVASGDESTGISTI